ncbi:MULTISPECIES: hypothetical protein [unclassified Mesorhizobium]|nr:MULTISPECIES: hypothetical protein [unclassified Mesorhizobium]MBZ9673090.1 hypothetical protein [Mesorhizobium sp. ES1-3]
MYLPFERDNSSAATPDPLKTWAIWAERLSLDGKPANIILEWSLFGP